ncbi:hypothetical protein GGU45_002795 [Niabella hirudinis]
MVRDSSKTEKKSGSLSKFLYEFRLAHPLIGKNPELLLQELN